mgnify:CR=1 FL=1
MNGIDVYAQNLNSYLQHQGLQQQAWSSQFQYEEQCKHFQLPPDIIPLKLQTTVDRLRSEIKEWCGGKLNSY